MDDSKKTKVKPLQVSEETKLRIAEFFMKTSVPRILAARKAEEAKKKEE